MELTEDIGVRFRRLLHLGVVLTTALVLALPLLLGPALTPLVRALGGAGEHNCACGMRAGECGCPECERLEHERVVAQEQVRHHAVLRSSCDDGTGAPSPGALPVVPMPAFVSLPAVPFTIDDVVTPAESDPSLERARPPTPPPRRAAV